MIDYPAERFSTRWRADTLEISASGAVAEWRPGWPDLPAFIERIDVPAGMRVRAVEAIAIRTESMGRAAWVPPAWEMRPAGPAARSAPDPRVYARPALHPEPLASLGYQGRQRGLDVAYVSVHPVRWNPASGQLDRVTRLRMRVFLEPGEDLDLVARERIVAEWEDGPVPAGSGALVTTATPSGPRAQPFAPTQIPSVLGSPVAYVIVTSDALADEFQRLADWKTRSGVPAAVRTLSFIRQQYSGTDDADRIRRFLRDAYARWGTKWVLLGGDTEVIPTRLAYTTFYTSVGGPLNDIATDLYYSCLDGNWNADGDALYGEGYISASNPGDAADLLPEVYVGRAPVTTVEGARRFVDKTFQYGRTPVGDYENKILFFAEVLDPADWTPGAYVFFDGAELAEEALPYLKPNPALRYARLYENHLDPRWEPGAVQETKARVIDSLNAGYNLAVHSGHGYRNVASCGDSSITNGDALALVNTNRLFHLYAINCTSNAIDFPCLGEAFVNGPAGAVSTTGSTRLDFPHVGRAYEKEFFRLVFRDSASAVGEAQARQKLPFLAGATIDGVHRWTQMTLLLLGDPELRIWTGLPRTLTVAHPASYAADETLLVVNVKVGGQNLAGARVTVYKASDEYRTGLTDGAGNVALDFRPDGTGSFLLTATAYDAVPYHVSVPVTASLGPLLVEGVPVLDDDGVGGTSGNNDRLLDAGETVDIVIPVRNSGTVAAAGVVGSLATTDPLVTVLVAGATYGAIAPGSQATPAGAFRIHASPALPDQREIPFTLTLTDGAGRRFRESLALTLHAPEPRHFSHVVTELSGDGDGIPEVGEEVSYSVRLRNLGSGTASSVTALLRCYDGRALVSDSTASFGDILSGAEALGDPFVFTVVDASALLELRVSGTYGPLWTQTIDLSAPSIPTSLEPRGASTSIQLTWTKSPEADLLGYHVFRGPSASGPFAKVNPIPTDRTSYYLDEGLAGLTRYWYRIAAVDSSGNESGPTAPVDGTTSPPYHAVFPIAMGGNSPASVAVASIYRPGEMTLIAGANRLHVWHADGTAPVDADNSSVTSGDFTILGSYYAGGASVGDLDGGGLEIVATTWHSQRVYAFDTQGQLKPGWPFVAATPIWSLAAIGDLDNDGSREVVFGSNGAAIYALRADGSEWMDGDANPGTAGVFKVLAANLNFGTPAIVDLDGNGQRDILYGGFDGLLHAWRPDGTNLPGFPVTLGGNITASVAVGYLDGPTDNQIEIVVPSGGGDDSLYVIRADGGRRPGFPVYVPTSGTSKQPSPALADLDGDGFLDIVAAGTDGRLHVFDRNGVPHPGFSNVRYSQLTSAASESSPVVADINGDGVPDIVMGDETGMLNAFSGTGAGQMGSAVPLPGFPIRIGGEVRGTPALCDCDGDGLTEIAVVGWDGNLYVWDYDFPFSPGAVPAWPQFHHDAMRTGFASSLIQVDTQSTRPPSALSLAPPFPNPSRRQVRILYGIPARQAGEPLDLTVFDLSGRTIRRLAAGPAAAGNAEASWDLRAESGQRVGAGLYLLALRVGDARRVTRLVVLP